MLVCLSDLLSFAYRALAIRNGNPIRNRINPPSYGPESESAIHNSDCYFFMSSSSFVRLFCKLLKDTRFKTYLKLKIYNIDIKQKIAFYL